MKRKYYAFAVALVIIGFVAGFIVGVDKKIVWYLPKPKPEPIVGEVVRVAVGDEYFNFGRDYLYTVKLNDEKAVQYVHRRARIQQFDVGDVIQVYAFYNSAWDGAFYNVYTEAKLIGNCDC